MAMSNVQKRTTVFKQLLNNPELDFLCEAHNGITARIAEEAGFNAIWAGGLCMSAQYGVRDSNEASWTQVLEMLEFMADASSVPILLDGDTGYGYRAVGEFDNLGDPGVAQQVDDLSCGLLVRVDDLVHPEFTDGDGRVVGPEGRVTHASDGLGASEFAGDETGKQVHLIAIRHGQEDVALTGRGQTQVVRRAARAGDDVAIDGAAQGAGPVGIGLDDGHVVLLFAEDAGEGITHAASAVDDDLHKFSADRTRGQTGVPL
jgi:hypothetical protein